MSNNSNFPLNNGGVNPANVPQTAGVFPPPLYPGEYIDLSRDEDQGRIVIDLTGDDDPMDVDPPQDAGGHPQPVTQATPQPPSNVMPPPTALPHAPVVPVAPTPPQDLTRLRNLAPSTFTRPDGQRVHLPAMLPCVFEQPDAPPIVAEVAAQLARDKDNGKGKAKASEHTSSSSTASNVAPSNPANITTTRPFDGTPVHQGIFRTFTNVDQGSASNSNPSNVIQRTTRDIRPFDGTRVHEGIFRTFSAPPSENTSNSRNLSVPQPVGGEDNGSAAQPPEGNTSDQQESDASSRRGQLTTTTTNMVSLSGLFNAPGGLNLTLLYHPMICYMCGKEQTGNEGTVWRGECGHWCHWDCVNKWLEEEDNFGFPQCPCGPTR